MNVGKNLIISSAAFVASLASVCAQGAECVVEVDGGLSLTRPAVHFKPVVHAFNWRSMSAGVPTSDKPAGTFAIHIAEGQTLRGKIEAQSADDGAVQVRYAFESEAELDVDSISIAADLASSSICGGTWSADDSGGAVPHEIQTEKIHLFIGRTRRFRIEGPADSGFALELAFKEPTFVLLQDSRKWGGSSFTLRIAPPGDSKLVRGETFAVDFALKGPEPLALVHDAPVTITAGEDWIPLRQSLDIAPGSALDFSTLVPWHAPAGLHGRVVAEDGGFAFENLPGVRQRFYGANLCFSANYLSDAEAATLAARFRRIGYNTVRLHHHDNLLVEGAPDKTAANPARFAQLDALMAACITNGIYVTTDLFVSRSIPWRSIGEDRDGSIPMNHFKILCAVHAGAMANWKAFAREFLDHVNPHTGRRYADEPALAWLSLVNEGNLGNFVGAQRELPQYAAAWKRWLADRRAKSAGYADVPETIPENIYGGGAHAAAYLQFLNDIETAMAAEMAAFVRDELKCRALITNANGWTNPLCGQIPRQDVCDYVDDHFYIDHPHFLEKSWTLPSRCPNTNPFMNAEMGMRPNAFVRLAGKPFTISEYNYSAPGRYRGVGGIATGAIGALQDWSILWRFAYSHGRDGMFKPARLSYFNVVDDPLMLASERASLCLFLRGDVQPLAKSLTVVIPRATGSEAQTSGMPFVAPGWSDVAWKARVQTALDQAPGDTAWSLDAAVAYAPEGAAKARQLVESEPFGGGAIRVNAGKGIFVIDTPRTAGCFAEGGGVEAGCLNVNILGTPATVWVSALDDRPCASSARLLLTHLTDVQNTGIRYAERARRTLLDWGALPHLVQRGRAEIALTLDNPAACTVYRLASDGTRLGVVGARATATTLAFTADTGAIAGEATILYEIVRN